MSIIYGTSTSCAKGATAKLIAKAKIERNFKSMSLPCSPHLHHWAFCSGLAPRFMVTVDFRLVHHPTHCRPVSRDESIDETRFFRPSSKCRETSPSCSHHRMTKVRSVANLLRNVVLSPRIRIEHSWRNNAYVPRHDMFGRVP